MQNESKRNPHYSMPKEDYLTSSIASKQIDPWHQGPNDEAFVMGMGKHTKPDGTISEFPYLGEVFDQIFTTNQYKIVKKLRNSTAEYAKDLNIGDIIEFHIYLREGGFRHPDIDMIKNGKIFKKVYNNEIHKLFNEDNPIYQIERV